MDYREVRKILMDDPAFNSHLEEIGYTGVYEFSIKCPDVFEDILQNVADNLQKINSERNPSGDDLQKEIFRGLDDVTIPGKEDVRAWLGIHVNSSNGYIFKGLYKL